MTSTSTGGGARGGDAHRKELRSAISHLQERGLYSASKWAAELLVGVEPQQQHQRHHFSASSTRRHLSTSGAAAAATTSCSSSSTGQHQHYHPSSASALLRGTLRSSAAATSASDAPGTSSASLAAATTTPIAGVSYVSTPTFASESKVDNLDDYAASDSYMLAKSYFDCKEYRRAAYTLRHLTDKKSVFLRSYSLYLAGEKRKEEEMIELEGPLGKSDIMNKELVSLERELSQLRKIGGIDPFGLYLYGIILKDKGCESSARAVLVESVNSYPWNWSAWTELLALCTSFDILNNINLKNHWMKDFFLGSAYQELKMYSEALAKFEYLLGIFKFSDYIHAQIATIQYSVREFDEAEVIFQELLKTDPYRVDFMDIYSNLLYAKECFSALSSLAHQVFLTDKYRPESCCVIANYFSLKGQHEKSVVYFRRALRLNGKYLAAWTLMGHEYVEMKNTPAAIDAYRRAVEINPRDYRAWYGLGQTYEMMNMPFYGLYYFKKSAYLQPNDARLWVAMAQCYESPTISMFEEAIKCYKNAANSSDREGIALHQLAKLHNSLGNTEQAMFYYKKDLERMDAEEREGQNMIEALMFLAKHCKAQQKFEEAQMYCNRLLNCTGPERETARSILRGLKSSRHSGFSPMDADHFPP